MNLKNNSLLLTLTYLLTMFIPNVLLTFFKNNNLYYSSVTVCSLLGMSAMLFFNNKYPFNNFIAPKKSSLLTVIGWGIMGTIAALALQRISFFIETTFFQQSIVSQNTAETLTVLTHYPYYILFVVLAAPIMEELVFRKVLFGNLATLIGPVGSALVSSTLFSIAHQDGHFITYAVMGLIFCFIYTKTGKITASMLSHILLNLLIIVFSLI
ncbi:CAAX family protease [Liquorilactobacillus aquaticus DSM 21051]|uniref:CAAX family protease n=1 Tax=Liquorilactobacillus aquaticus DSM 21051 TaxID=1423725 RepID=A0A0R2CVR3_9LACO|nr:CPBP family intramembrane glutamic endopeptidase [Liquorilactobacillus aquaticus]KRM95886.1 CAAX family protease [Liquorilactobacillus aquaticus DSM 21051]